METEKKVYTDDELYIVDGYEDEREEFLKTGILPGITNWRLRFGTTISAGLVAEFFCFLPGMGIWLYGNMLSVGVFKQMSMANPIIAQLPNTSNKEGFMLLLLSIAIVFFDIIGLGAEQAAGLYDGAKFLDIRRRKGFQRGETLKENCRHQIDPGVGTLGGQARGEQQLIVLLCLKGTGIRIMLF